ncbi:MAG: hypothetical protein OXH11_19095 [Candidatus Aminicenantes bacterium]|nr:hypothetical protein [Candidatus Aminicenantes bacterium]
MHVVPEALLVSWRERKGSRRVRTVESNQRARLALEPGARQRLRTAASK